jgi:hypothetical protein
MKIFVLYFVFLGTIFANDLCELHDPDKTMETNFLNSTGYVVAYGDLSTKIVDFNQRLKKYGLTHNYNFDKYAIYTIYQNTNIIGHILCLNETYYNFQTMQFVVLYDAKGKVKNVKYQKLLGENFNKFTAPAFTEQFVAINSPDFKRSIKNPSPDDAEIFDKTIISFKKNLILMDTFIFNKSL